MFAALTIACLFGTMSSLATYSQKRIYKDFTKFSSPLAMLWFQCVINLALGSVLLTMKARKSKLLAWFEQKSALVVPTAEQLPQKKLALITGLTSFSTIIFGIVAVKNVNIPMFLAFRRCALVTTVLLMWLHTSQKPNH